MYQKYTGIILKKHPLGEADEMLTVYTRESGKIRCKAVSSRKIKSRTAGHILTLNEIDFETAQNSRRSTGLPVLVSVRVSAVNGYLRENLRKFAAATVAAETIYRLTPDFQESRESYELLANFLRNLGETRLENQLLRRFQLEFLKSSGYEIRPEYLEISEAVRQQLTTLAAGRSLDHLLPAAERAIDRHIEYVLEREIKANSFLSALNSKSETNSND